MIKTIYCFGTSGGCLDSFFLCKELCGGVERIKFLSDIHDVGEPLYGATVEGPFAHVAELQSKNAEFIYQCGSDKNHRDRHLWFEKAISFGLTPRTLISPEAFVHETASLGQGCILYPGAKIMTNVTLGRNCIVLPNTVINHDSFIGDFSIINSACVINGHVEIGRNSYIGSCTSIKERLSIHRNATVGMNSVVLKSIESEGIYYGFPAKRRRDQLSG